MKIFLLIITVIFFTFPKTNFWLNGKYRVVPDGYEPEYLIIFHDDSLYTKVFKNSRDIRGVVEYGKNLIYLYDFENYPQIPGQKTISVRKQEELTSIENIRKDTINFCFYKNVKGGPASWLHICRNSGKFIKVK